MTYGLTVASAGTPANPEADGTMIAAAGVSLAVVLMPIAFLAVALMTRRPEWPLMVFYAMGVALGVGLPLLILRNPMISIIAGYAAGAVLVVSLPEGRTWHNRAVAAVIVTVVTILGLMIAFVPTAIIAPALPFMAVGLADTFGPRRV